MKIVKRAPRQGVEHLMSDHQGLAVGSKGQPPDVVGRYRSDGFQRCLCQSTRAKLAAERVGDYKFGPVA